MSRIRYRIVYKSYVDSICNYKDGFNDWSGKVYNLLIMFDLSHLWELQGSINRNTYSNLYRNSLHQAYPSYWIEQINKQESNKLRTY